MKRILFTSVLLITCFLQAQSLKKYIPYDASIVASINGSNILESVAIQEFNESEFGKKILKEVNKNLTTPLNSIDELGVDLEAISYVYMRYTDSLSYNVAVFPLKNNTFIKSYVKNEDVMNKRGYKLYKLNHSKYMAWDNKKLVLISGNYNNMYFTEDYDFSLAEAELVESNKKNQTNNGLNEELPVEEIPEFEIGAYDIPYLSNYSLQGYLNEYFNFGEAFKLAANSNNLSEIEALSAQVEILKEHVKEVDSIYEYDATSLDDFMKNKVYFLKKEADKITDKNTRKKAIELIKEASFYKENFSIIPQYDPYNYYSEEKNFLENKWVVNMVSEVMKPAKKSITSNKKYANQFDDKAIINVWNPYIGDTFMNWYNSFGLNLDNAGNVYKGLGEASSNLYFEEKQARIDFNMTLSNTMSKRFERVFDKKINQNFFNYINEDKFLGYITYNLNMKSTLEEYPKIMAETYESYSMRVTSEEVEMMADLFTLMLDEEAVSKVINGDVMFVLSGITEQEVTYIDYEYDEDYSYKEIEKTKNEQVPEFLLMVSTEDTRLTNKFINYLISKELVVKENGYYKAVKAERDFPLGLYFTIKDGIFFLGTSEAKMASIVNNTVVAKLGADHRKIINQGNYSMYVNGERLAKQIPLDELNREELRMANYFINNASNFYIKSSKIKNNSIKTEAIMETPEGHKNSLKYMLNFIDEIFSKNEKI